MDIVLLDDIIRDCLPHETIDPDNPPAHVRIIDVFALQVAVDLNRANRRRAELIQLLDDYPTEAWGQPLHRLADGPSYIEVGAAVDGQQRALMLFAIGEALELWTVIIPNTLGAVGDEAAQLAGMGLIMIDGYHPAPTQAST